MFKGDITILILGQIIVISILLIQDPVTYYYRDTELTSS